MADGTLKDETTVLGLLLARERLGRRREAAVRRRCRSAAEEYLSWLEVERGARRGPWRRTGATCGLDDALAAAWLRRHRRRSVGRVAELPGASCGCPQRGLVARAHSSIRGFYRFLVEEGRRDDDPAADLPSVSVSDLLPKALSEEETERLLGAVVGTGPAVLRDRALLEVLYGTGPG